MRLFHILPITLVFIISCFCQSASADLVVTSENFDGTAAGDVRDFGAQGTPGDWGDNAFRMGIAGWGELDNGPGFNEFLLDIGNGGFIDPGQTTATSGLTAGINGNGSYLYREIGTNSSFASVNVSGDNITRNGPLTSSIQSNDLLVELFTLDANDSFAFAEFGNDIGDAAVGATLIGSGIATSTATGGDVNPFSFDFDLTGTAVDDRIFVRLSSVGADTGGPTLFAYVDNLSFSSTAIPEPGSAGLIALSLCGIGMLRRRNN
jgi:hypothetical protein